MPKPSHQTMHSVFLYGVVGVASYVVELSLILFLSYAVHVDQTLSVAVAFWVGLLVSFLLQKMITFRSDNYTHTTKRQFFFYGALVLFNYLFTVGFVYVFSNLDVTITRTIALIITTIWNYLLYRKVIFK